MAQNKKEENLREQTALQKASESVKNVQMAVLGEAMPEKLTAPRRAPGKSKGVEDKEMKVTEVPNIMSLHGTSTFYLSILISNNVTSNE